MGIKVKSNTELSHTQPWPECSGELSAPNIYKIYKRFSKKLDYILNTVSEIYRKLNNKKKWERQCLKFGKRKSHKVSVQQILKLYSWKISKHWWNSERWAVVEDAVLKRGGGEKFQRL